MKKRQESDFSRLCCARLCSSVNLLADYKELSKHVNTLFDFKTSALPSCNSFPKIRPLSSCYRCRCSSCEQHELPNCVANC